MTIPIGVNLTAIPDVAPLLRALLAGEPLAAELPDGLSGDSLHYAVLQCTDTFVWGVPDGAGWLWSNDADPALRPPRLETLLEARLFGPDAEILAWRDASTSREFAARLAVDAEVPEDVVLAPLDREAAFAGTPKDLPGTPFRRWTTGGGKVTVAPAGSWLRVREYLGACPDTGVLRIAMTRFLEVI